MYPVFFDPMVLQRYESDPRYLFRFHDFTGMLSTADEYFLSADFPDDDKVLVDTFGQGWRDGKPQAIVVYLAYLGKLSPRHQEHWHGFELPDQGTYELDRDYVRTSVLGEFPDRPAAVEAILAEQGVVNDLAAALGHPALFRHLFNTGDRPAGLNPFLLPSRAQMDRFILHLDQVLSENINEKFFGGEVDRFESQSLPDGRIQRIRKGSIRILKDWLEASYPDNPDLASAVTGSLAEVRDLRRDPAHRITTNEIDPAVWAERSRLLGGVHASVRALRQELSKDPATNGVEMPDWLDGPVRTY
jgi:hypothetical protein